MDMDTKRLIYEKLFKENRRFNFAITDDIQKLSNVASKELDGAAKASKKALDGINDAINAYRQNAILSKEVLGKINLIKTQAKELGLDLPSNILKIETDLTTNVKNSTSKISDLQSAKGSI